MTFGLLDHSKMHNQLYANIDVVSVLRANGWCLFWPGTAQF